MLQAHSGREPWPSPCVDRHVVGSHGPLGEGHAVAHPANGSQGADWWFPEDVRFQFAQMETLASVLVH